MRLSSTRCCYVPAAGALMMAYGEPKATVFVTRMSQYCPRGVLICACDHYVWLSDSHPYHPLRHWQWVNQRFRPTLDSSGIQALGYYRGRHVINSYNKLIR